MLVDMIPANHNVIPVFNKRPIPIAAEFRPRWKMGCILLAYGICGRGETRKIKVSKARILAWALRSSEGKEALDGYFSGRVDLCTPMLRYEPTYVRAFNMMLGMDLVNPVKDGVTSLTSIGIKMYNVIMADEGLMEQEKDFLKAVKSRLTNEVVIALEGGEL